MSTVGSFFCGGPFLRGFWSSKMQKKGHSRISEEKMTKISDFVCFIRVIFLQKREIFAYFCLYFQIFYILTPGANAGRNYYKTPKVALYKPITALFGCVSDQSLENDFYFIFRYFLENISFNPGLQRFNNFSKEKCLRNLGNRNEHPRKI